jgi:hypothetical protein
MAVKQLAGQVFEFQKRKKRRRRKIAFTSHGTITFLLEQAVTPAG